METPYSKAWTAFVESDEATRIIAMMERGTSAEYAKNRLRVAFECGWNERALLSSSPSEGESHGR